MTKLSFTRKCLGAGLLVAAALLTTTGTALSGGQPTPKIQIKIIIDGKEIDISDVKLLHHLQAAQAKPADKVPKDQPTTNKPAVPMFFEKKITQVFGQGGDIITTEKDGKIVITDAKTGKVIATFDRGGPGFGPIQFQIPVGKPQAKPDPRIEELVKQAEAIKPGSGPAVRMVLQGGPPVGPMGGFQQANPGNAWQRGGPWNWNAGGRGIMVPDKDGKPRQLTEEEMKKMMTGKPPFPFDAEMMKRFLPPNAGQGGQFPWRFEIELGQKIIDTKPMPNPPTKPGPRSPEIEDLRRQVEQLHESLNALRKRIETQK
ncbi:MAG: hypothetical protein EXS16_10720 [Gemmataceae bacterium]|nr:hypothetical protein [Gemmataceae bacterium]